MFWTVYYPVGSFFSSDAVQHSSGLNGMMYNHKDHFKMLWHRNTVVNKIPKHKPNPKNKASDLRLQTTNSPADTYCAHKYFLVLFLRFVSVFYSYKNFFFYFTVLLHYFWTGRNHRGSLHCYKNKFHAGLNGMGKNTVVGHLSSFLSGHFLAE